MENFFAKRNLAKVFVMSSIPSCEIQQTYENWQKFTIEKCNCCEEIQNGAVPKSYMRKGLIKYEEMRIYLTKYEEATAPFRISLYMRKI
jgi:hypothetical protein